MILASMHVIFDMVLGIWLSFFTLYLLDAVGNYIYVL